MRRGPRPKNDDDERRTRRCRDSAVQPSSFPDDTFSYPPPPAPPPSKLPASSSPHRCTTITTAVVVVVVVVVVVIFSSSPMMRAVSRRGIIIGRRRRRRDTPRSRHCRSGYTPAVRRRSNPTRIPTRRRTSPTTNARDVSFTTTASVFACCSVFRWLMLSFILLHRCTIYVGGIFSLSLSLGWTVSKNKKINARRPPAAYITHRMQCTRSVSRRGRTACSATSDWRMRHTTSRGGCRS